MAKQGLTVCKTSPARPLNTTYGAWPGRTSTVARINSGYQVNAVMTALR